MDQLSIAICDGNERDMEILETHIRKSFPDAEITSFTQGQSLIDQVVENPNQFQVIFMETEFPDDNGIRIAAEIRKLNKSAGIIFANYAQTECQFRYCGTAIPFLTVRSTAR